MKKNCVWSLVLIVFVIHISACKSRPDNNTNLAEAGLTAASFIGPWVAQYVDIGLNGERKSPEIHFDSKDIASTQGRKPAMTIFVADGSYREEIYSSTDSLIQSKSGFWHLFEDSLYMRLEGNNTKKIAFHASLAGKGLLLISKIDWDADGEADDLMQVRLKRP